MNARKWEGKYEWEAVDHLKMWNSIGTNNLATRWSTRWNCGAQHVTKRKEGALHVTCNWAMRSTAWAHVGVSNYIALGHSSALVRYGKMSVKSMRFWEKLWDWYWMCSMCAICNFVGCVNAISEKCRQCLSRDGSYNACGRKGHGSQNSHIWLLARQELELWKLPLVYVEP